MGKIIAFYGINNIGKTTQALRIVDFLNNKGFKAFYVKYPVYDIEPSGPYINSLLRSSAWQNITEEEMQMWFTVNRFQYEPVLKKIMEENDFVILEDYVQTGIAWGSIKGADKNWLEMINEPLIKEDLCTLLDGERDISAMEKGHIHEESDDLIGRCREFYLERAKEKGWKIVNVSEDWDVTTERILKIIKVII